MLLPTPQKAATRGSDPAPQESWPLQPNGTPLTTGSQAWLLTVACRRGDPEHQQGSAPVMRGGVRGDDRTFENRFGWPCFGGHYFGWPGGPDRCCSWPEAPPRAGLVAQA